MVPLLICSLLQSAAPAPSLVLRDDKGNLAYRFVCSLLDSRLTAATTHTSSQMPTTQTLRMLCSPGHVAPLRRLIIWG